MQIFIFLILITTNVFAVSNFEKLIEIEESKVQVQRKVDERDVILFGKFASYAIENAIVGNEIRNSLYNLISSKANLKPILEENSNFSVPSVIQEYEVFKENGISYIINGSIRFEKGMFYIKIFIWDAYKYGKILEKEFSFLPEEKNLFTKQLATLVYEFLTGEFGFFYGKLLYTLTERPGVKPFKKVVLSEVKDGVISATLFTNGDDITFNPKYCTNTNEVFFTSQKPKKAAEIMIANRVSGVVERLIIPEFENQRKILFSPTISKDCTKIAFSVSENGSTNIYIFNRNTEKLTMLTNTKNTINTAPFFFNNDKKIIFVSDRQGKANIWEMKIDGSEQKRISQGDGAYYSPSVSSDGKKIAFVKVKSGVFSLGIANTDGSKEDLIHSAFLIENPIWAPIGKTIIFSMKPSSKEKSRVYAISFNGRKPEELPALKGSLNEPKWVDEF